MIKAKLIKVTTRDINLDIDLKYSTNDNFTKKKIYSRNELYLNPIAFEHLHVAVELASKIGFRIKIFDGFRPTQSQKKLWDFLPNPDFIMPPTKGSPHSRGTAVDLTLVDKNNNELDMGTGFDEFSSLSYHSSKYISKKAFRNRMLLLGLMTSAGWDFFRNEWWHYQLFNSKKFPLLGDEHLELPLTIA
tara:strand:+ start:4263 stop:4829 length:567 start_codon:yes stop_codon:yes gene_type:complete